MPSSKSRPREIRTKHSSGPSSEYVRRDHLVQLALSAEKGDREAIKKLLGVAIFAAKRLEAVYQSHPGILRDVIAGGSEYPIVRTTNKSLQSKRDSMFADIASGCTCPFFGHKRTRTIEDREIEAYLRMVDFERKTNNGLKLADFGPLTFRRWIAEATKLAFGGFIIVDPVSKRPIRTPASEMLTRLAAPLRALKKRQAKQRAQLLKDYPVEPKEEDDFIAATKYQIRKQRIETQGLRVSDYRTGFAETLTRRLKRPNWK